MFDAQNSKNKSVFQSTVMTQAHPLPIYHNQPSSINSIPTWLIHKTSKPHTEVFYKPGPLSTINSHGDGYLAGGAGDVVARIAAGAMIDGLGRKLRKPWD